jgi:hypothetical protein
MELVKIYAGFVFALGRAHILSIVATTIALALLERMRYSRAAMRGHFLT